MNKTNSKEEGRQTLLFAGLSIFLIISVVLSLGIGRYSISPARVLGITASRLFPVQEFWTDTDFRVVILVRAPRVLLSLVCGAGLAMSGAVLQGVFRNPLAGPQVIGITSGSGFGGALAIVLFHSQAATMGMAFVFGMIALFAVFALSRSDGRSPILMVVLAGVITSAFFTALTSLLKYTADPYDKLPAIVMWLMGSFASSTYTQLLAVFPPVAVSMLLLYLMRFRINILSLGDEEAEAIGVKPDRLRWSMLLAVTVIASAVVSAAGIIGWVGLVVPHIARMLTGPDHRKLVPASILLGGSYLLWIDNAARAATKAEIPVGIITAVIGAPVFAYFLHKTKGRGWGNG